MRIGRLSSMAAECDRFLICAARIIFLGIKGIRLGPTLPAFLSPNVAKVLVEKFDIKPTGDVKEDVAAMMSAA